MNSMDAFLSRMNSTIIQWRTYLACLNGDTLVLSNAKVDEFVAMVERMWLAREPGAGSGEQG
jgi:hypothetical protein